jgi:hypothetical protein
MRHLSLVALSALLFARGPAPGQQVKQDRAAGELETHRILSLHFDDHPPVHFEPAPSSDLPDRALVTNFHREPLSAFVLAVGPEPDSQSPPWFELFDVAARTAMQSSIPRGLTLVVGIQHAPGTAVPPAKIAAAVWEDGSTFGPKDALEKIYENRRATLAAYDVVLSVLRTSAEKKWTIDQCVEALEKAKVASPASIAVSANPAASQLNRTIYIAETALQAPRGVQAEIVVPSVLKIFNQRRDQLATSLPGIFEHPRTEK